MCVTLIVVGGPHRGRRIPIRVPEFLIGRDPACHLRPASKDVKWEHCALVTNEGRAFLRDDSNGQGTYLNNRLLVGGEMQLENDDLIRVGPLSFKVTLVPPVLADFPDADEEIADATRFPDYATHRKPASGDTERRDFPAAPHGRSSSFVPQRMRDSREILYW